MKLKLFAVMLLATQCAYADDLYRWVDKEGKVHYGDIVPSEIEDAETPKFITSTASSVNATNYPYESREAAKNFPVTLYVMEKCGDVCAQARSLLSKRQVPYTEVMLKTAEEFESFRQKSGGDTVPSVLIGKAWLKGFLSSQWNDELDAAGYPKPR